MFYDRAKIWVKAGNGGNGSASFRREKFIPKGGPDGGDGGRGGSVYIRVNPDMNTLLPFYYKQHYKAEHGGSGAGQQKHGKAAKDLYIEVPPGTMVEVLDENPISGAAVEAYQEDLVRPGHAIMVARGGRGGLGNTHFATSTHQTPRFAERGEPAEERTVLLELKIIADVGLIGYPNVGKSTLLSTVSAAQPKVADYPFTTLEPMLGVVSVDEDSFVMADIPGLIEGASSGAGLGLEFLRHVERTRVLVHIVDGAAGLWWGTTAAEGEPVRTGEEDTSGVHPSQATDPVADFKRINSELRQYDPEMSDKPQFVAINKTDIPEVQSRVPTLEKEFRAMGHEVFPISAATGEGVQTLMRTVAAKLRELPRPEWAPEEGEEGDGSDEVVVSPRHIASEARRFQVKPEGKGRYRVVGPTVVRTVVMTDMNNQYALERLQKELAKMGVSKALSDAGVVPGDMVAFGTTELEWSDEPWVRFDQSTSRRKKREGPGKQKS